MLTPYKSICWQVSFFLCFCTLATLITCTIAHAEDRIALVIGNGAYTTEKQLITHAHVNDIKNMKNALESIGFSVTPIRDANLETMRKEIRAFITRLDKSDEKVTAIFYYSGHSIKYKEKHYLLPVGSIDHINNISIGFSDIPYKTIPLEGWVVEMLQKVENRKKDEDTIIFIFDGYRKYVDMFRRTDHSRSDVRGFNPKGIGIEAKIICSGGISDSMTQKYNFFTKFFAHFMSKPNLNINDIFNKAAMEVHKVTDSQYPWKSGGYSKLTLNPTTVLPEEPMLEVIMATLTVTTNVRGAKLFVNENKKGFTPINVELQFGTYDIRIEKNDYFPFISKSVNVNRREQRLHANLIEKAFLRIHSTTQGAEVFINGKYYGTTPINYEIELPFGQHTVQLKKNSYFVEKEVDITQREVHIEFPDQKEEAFLIVSSNVDGAKVLINGEIKGYTPLKIILSPEKRYTVWIAKLGYRLLTPSQGFYLRRGNKKELHFEMMKIRGQY